MVEPNPNFRLGSADRYGDLLQRADGYGARTDLGRPMLLIVFPVVISICFLMIADIDAPRSGLIRVRPQNLVALSDSRPKQEAWPTTTSYHNLR